MLSDATYTCHACGETIVIPVDPSQGNSQEYVEDCPVCCRPNVIRVDFTGEEPTAYAESEG